MIYLSTSVNSCTRINIISSDQRHYLQWHELIKVSTHSLYQGVWKYQDNWLVHIMTVNLVNCCWFMCFSPSYSFLDNDGKYNNNIISFFDTTFHAYEYNNVNLLISIIQNIGNSFFFSSHVNILCIYFRLNEIYCISVCIEYLNE